MTHESADIGESGAAALEALARAARVGACVVPVGAGLRQRLPAEWGTRPVTPWPSTRFQAVRRWSAPDLTVEVDAGLSWEDLNQELAPEGQWLPVGVPDGAPDTLGGIVSAGVSGVWSGGYSPIRDRVLSMTVAVPTFEVVRVGAPVVKNVAGYNLWRLYWATRGTFGIVLTITWKLAALPRAAAALACSDSGPLTPQVWEEMRRWRDSIPTTPALAALLLTIQPSGWELMGIAHGGDAAMDRLRRTLGAQLGAGLDVGLPRPFEDRVAWQARLPREGQRRVLEELSRQGWRARAELQSGMVWGYGTEPDGAGQAVAELVASHGGALRSWDGPAPSLVVPGADADKWQRLKEAVDPHGILPTWPRETEG